MKAKTSDTLSGIFVGLACALILIVMACLSTGCSTTRGTIEAATTQIKIEQGKNKSFAVAFPKELQTTGFHLHLDPKSGEIKIDADQLKSSSTGIIESAGVAQAQAMAAMSQTLNTALSALMPILARAATGFDFPALPLPVPAAPAPQAAPVIAPIAPFVVPGITPEK